MNNPMGAITCLRSVGILLESVEGLFYEALMHHAENGHYKRMMATLRAGLDPHKRIVTWEYPDGTQETGNVVEAVIHTGKPWLLEMLKPSPEKDDAGGGMHLGDRRMLEVLVECGFALNGQQNGGSPAMHSVLTTADLFRISPNSRGLDSYGWSRFVADVEWLIEIGAKWGGRDSGEYRMIRDALLGIGETGAIQIRNMLLVEAVGKRSPSAFLWEVQYSDHGPVYRRKRPLPTDPTAMRQRASLVEHPFSIIKDRHGYTGRLCKGIRQASAEMNLNAWAYNFTRVVNLVGLGVLLGTIGHLNAPPLA